MGGENADLEVSEAAGPAPGWPHFPKMAPPAATFMQASLFLGNQMTKMNSRLSIAQPEAAAKLLELIQMRLAAQDVFA